MTGVTMTEALAVADVVERWRSSYEAADAAGLKALWDREHVPLTYLPTERDQVLTTWDAISTYYDRVCSGIVVREWRVWDVVVDVIAETSAFAVAHTGFTYRVRADAQAAEQYWEGRVAFNFQRRDGAWKLIHYEDSTLWDWVVPLLFEWQAPRVAEAEAAVRAGDSARALALLAALRTPPGLSALTTIARPKA
jgi:hypothetical protein